MTGQFSYQPSASRVIFGSGMIARLGDEVQALGGTPMIVSTSGQAKLAGIIADRTGLADFTLWPGAAMHTPLHTVDAAVVAAASVGARCIVSIGGGSAIGLAKGVARRTGLPFIAVPTTYSGSEATPVWGESVDGIKTTGKDIAALAKAIIYDPDLNRGLPPSTSAASAMNAIAHAVEGLYSAEVNPVSSMKAHRGIELLSRALPRIMVSPDDLEARSDAFLGGWLCGMVLAEVGMGLHHKLCHTLGGAIGLSHAEMHAVLIPHTLAYNAGFVPEVDRQIARALGSSTGAGGLYDLLHALPIPKSLQELGMTRADIATVTALAAARPYPNPAPLVAEKLERLLVNAWAGSAPELLFNDDVLEMAGLDGRRA